MANEIITTLHPDQDPDTNLYPNIKKENIPDKSIDKNKLDQNYINEIDNFFNDVNARIDDVNARIDDVSDGSPKYVGTTQQIMSLSENKGLAVSTDNGYWYYWSGTSYKYGGVYQTDPRYDELENFIISKLDNNLIEYNKLTYDYIVGNNDYKPVAFNGYCYTEFIPVESGKTYKSNKNDYFYCFYREKNYDSYISYGVVSNSMTIPDNVKYIVLSFISSAKITFTEGEYYEGEYRKYIKENQNNIEENRNDIDNIYSKINPNLFEKDKATLNQIIGHLGYTKPVVFEGYFISDFIRVTPNETYDYYSKGYFLNFYNDDTYDNFVQTIVTNSSGKVVIPDNANYVVISASNSIIDKLYFRNIMIFQNIKFETTKVIECGVGKEYTTLRSAIAKGVELGCKVVVYSGVYDLTQEFSDVISNQSGKGIELGNNVYIEFMSGSYVKANFDNSSRWIYDNFEPFYSTGNFTLDGLNIEASNCRYCVHDEHSGDKTNQTYHHVYINCIMKYTNTHTDINYVQCIGGGLGEHGYIDIIGGVYESVSTIPYPNHTIEKSSIPISYHNGYKNTCDGKIFIKDVYLVGYGYFKFGMYGSSTIKTPIIINSCSMGGSIDVSYENNEYNVENFKLTEWNNTIRNI